MRRSRERLGLVIGKFLPPHAGHVRLFEFARQHVATLHLILFSKSTEPIPGAMRAAWLRELAPGAQVHHVTQEHRVDFADSAAWDYWVEAIRLALPTAPDIVFSSEPYGAELARRLGARHMPFDPSRQEVPISAAQIRAHPLAHWPFIPPPVRPHYVRRLAIVGAESTGKTTLALALAAHFDTVCVPEFAREYLLARGGGCTAADMPVIAAGQAAFEDERARQANRLLVCDTDLLTTRLWHEHYFGDCPADLMQLSQKRAAHAYVVCESDLPWVADGLRDSPDARLWFHGRFIEELSQHGLPYVVVSGTREARLAAAIEMGRNVCLT